MVSCTGTKFNFPHQEYVQNENIIFANYLVKSKIIDKNYLIYRDCVGFEIDTSNSNLKRKSYSIGFTKFILKNTKLDSVKLDDLFKPNKKCLENDLFSNFNLSILYSPISLSNDKFFMIKQVKRTDNFNYNSLFMVQLRMTNGKIKLVNVSGVWDN